MHKENLVKVPAGTIFLTGDLQVPDGAKGIVLFAHGSGSGRLSPRNQFVAKFLQQGGVGTLLIDLLTLEEEKIDEQTAHLRFDIPLLAERLCQITDWLVREKKNIGYFGASTGAAAALVAAAQKKKIVRAVVSRGGRPDLAGDALPLVEAPTLLIVGGRDDQVIQLNEEAFKALQCKKKLVIVPKATHLFEEAGTLEEVARLALEWFSLYVS